MKPLLVGFGDSWTFGSELDRPWEQSWVVQLANKLDAEPVNLGTPASSPGHLVVQLFDFIKKYPDFEDYKLIFMVGLSGTSRYLSYSREHQEFVNITPEAPYRTGNINKYGSPPQVVESLQDLKKQTYTQVQDSTYDNFLICQSIFAFQQFCGYNEIDCLFFSYFDMPNLDQFGHMLYKDYVYPVTITRALTGQEYQLPDILTNEYFTGKLFHPNWQGHTRIAELLYEQYIQTYS